MERERNNICIDSVAAHKDATCYHPLLGDNWTTGLCIGLSFSSFPQVSQKRVVNSGSTLEIQQELPSGSSSLPMAVELLELEDKSSSLWLLVEF